VGSTCCDADIGSSGFGRGNLGRGGSIGILPGLAAFAVCGVGGGNSGRVELGEYTDGGFGVGVGSGLLFGFGHMYKILVLAAVTVWVAVLTLPDDKLHVVFCDVGQGDAILIYQKTTQILIDAGPNDRVVGCLNRHMPFWDKQIEAAVATHPQADHIGGLVDVMKGYIIVQFVMGVEGNETAGFEAIRRQITMTKSQVTNVYYGDEIRIGDIKFEVVWPEKSWVFAHLELPDDSGSAVLGAKTDGTDLNSFSIGGILSFGQFDVLLTGDADWQIEDEMIEAGGLRSVEVLKVPHHGSKTGMTREWLGVVKPQLAVISAGKNNRYGHPAEETLKILRDKEIKILRTDVDGEVEIVSDGERWWVDK